MRSLPDTFTYDQEWQLNQKPFDLESEAQATQLHAPTKSTGMKRLCTHLSLASSCSSCCWTRISVLSSDTLPRTFVSRPAFVRGAHHTLQFTTADSGSGHWTGTNRIACNNLWSKIKTLSTIVQVSSLSQLKTRYPGRLSAVQFSWELHTRYYSSVLCEEGCRFVLFNDTWSQYGHSVSCMTIFF